jgi:hypothetical protein
MTDKPVLQPVTSTSLAAIGYDAGKQILSVQFTNGEIINYGSVDLGTALNLEAAESKGKFYATQIRGKFPGRRMTGPCPQCSAEGWIGDLCVCGTASYEEKLRDVPARREWKGR